MGLKILQPNKHLHRHITQNERFSDHSVTTSGYTLQVKDIMSKRQHHMWTMFLQACAPQKVKQLFQHHMWTMFWQACAPQKVDQNLCHDTNSMWTMFLQAYAPQEAKLLTFCQSTKTINMFAGTLQSIAPAPIFLHLISDKCTAPKLFNIISKMLVQLQLQFQHPNPISDIAKADVRNVKKTLITMSTDFI